MRVERCTRARSEQGSVPSNVSGKEEMLSEYVYFLPFDFRDEAVSAKGVLRSSYIGFFRLCMCFLSNLDYHHDGLKFDTGGKGAGHKH